MVGEMGECQHQHKCMHYKPRGVTRSESTFVDRRRSRRYEQSITTPMPQTVPSPRTLGPGEEVRRTFSWHDDIAGPLAFACVYGGFVLVGVGGAALPWPFVRGIVVGVDAVVCVVFTRLRWDTWKTGDTNPVVHKREAEKPQTPTGTKWETHSEVKEGQKTTIDRPTLTKPQAWHRFCKAVVKGRNFSQYQATRRNGVPMSDWLTMYDAWVSRGWIVPQEGKRAPRVRAIAMAHIRNYATTPPPDEG